MDKKVAIRPIITNSYVAIHIDIVNRYAGHLSKFTIPGMEIQGGRWHTKSVPLYRRVSMMCPETNLKEVYLLFPRHCAPDLACAQMIKNPQFSIKPFPILTNTLNFPDTADKFELYPLQEQIIDQAFKEYLTEFNRDHG